VVKKAMEKDEGEKTLQQLMIRCPRLGGEVPFAYCEREGGELPCRLTLRCWQTVFPVEAYLRGKLTDERWTRFLAQAPGDRIGTLLEGIETAKRRRQDNEENGQGGGL
jgi:hypothetical protein